MSARFFRETLVWLGRLSLPRLLTLLVTTNLAGMLASSLAATAGAPGSVEFMLMAAAVVGWLVIVAPWATTPVRDAWVPPRLRPGDELVEATIKRTDAVEHIVLVRHPDGEYEAFSGPVEVGPEDVLTVP